MSKEILEKNTDCILYSRDHLIEILSRHGAYIESEEDIYDELYFDSITIMEVAIEVENMFGIAFELEDLSEINFSNLYFIEQIIVERIYQKSRDKLDCVNKEGGDTNENAEEK